MDTLTTAEGERIDVRYHEAINHLHEAEANRRGLLDTYADTTAEDRNARIAAYHQAIGQHLKAGQVHALLAIADAVVGAAKHPERTDAEAELLEAVETIKTTGGRVEIGGVAVEAVNVGETIRYVELGAQ